MLPSSYREKCSRCGRLFDTVKQEGSTAPAAVYEVNPRLKLCAICVSELKLGQPTIDRRKTKTVQANVNLVA